MLTCRAGQPDARRRMAAAELVRRCGPSGGWCSSRASRRSPRGSSADDVAQLFEALALLPVTEAIARRAGRHLRRHRASHRGIDLADYLIGATAQEHHLELATRNVRHFPAIEGMRPPWT